MRMLNQLVHFSTVPLFFLDLAISSHCFSNSGSSSVSIMAWNVSLNAQALWRMARPELIYNIDIQQYTICTCTSLNNTIPKQKTFGYKIINKMSQFVLHVNWCVYRWGAYTCIQRKKARVLTGCVLVWVVLEGITTDQVHVLQELFACLVLMHVYLRHHSRQIHGLGDHIIVVRHLYV